MKSIRILLAGTLLAAGTILTAATSISIASAADEAATAAPPAMGPHGWHHGPGHLYAQLNLTAEQKGILSDKKRMQRGLHPFLCC